MRPVGERGPLLIGLVGLDDLHVARVLPANRASSAVNSYSTNWQGELDKKDMIRASRVPLGHIAKAYKNVRDIDIDRQTIGKGEKGYYHLCYRELQILEGQKSMNFKLYFERLLFEVDKCTLSLLVTEKDKA